MGSGPERDHVADAIQGVYHQGMTLGQYMKGNLMIWPELIE